MFDNHWVGKSIITTGLDPRLSTKSHGNYGVATDRMIEYVPQAFQQFIFDVVVMLGPIMEMSICS